MRDCTNGNVKADEDVVFYDGFLYIISQLDEPYSDSEGCHEAKYDIDVICLCPEYDDPLSLKDIAEKYPRVEKVLFEDCLRGILFNYGNHRYSKNAEMWEKVGDTLGYA
jgi:hypothetical protein